MRTIIVPALSVRNLLAFVFVFVALGTISLALSSPASAEDPFGIDNTVRACGSLDKPCPISTVENPPVSYGNPPGLPIGVTIEAGNSRKQVDFVDFLNENNGEMVGRVVAEPTAREKCGIGAGAVSTVWVGAKVGTSWSVTESPDGYLDVPGSGTVDSVKCISMKQSVEVLECVVSIKGSIEMTEPGKKSLGSKTQPSPFGKKKTLKNCRASQKISLKLRAEIKEYGRYTARSTGFTQRVKNTVTENPLRGTTSAKFEIVGPVVQKPERVNYAQKTCAGTKQKSTPFTGKVDFTQDDCANPPTTETSGGFQCKASDTTWVNGKKAKSATVFRDGSANTVTFSVPKLSGKTFVKNSQSIAKTRISRSGTPWDKSATKDKTPLQIMKKGSTSPLKVNSRDTTAYVNGGISSYHVYGYLASDAKAPTKLQNEFVLQGKWKVETQIITEIKLDGTMVLKAGPTKTITSTATCLSPEVSLNFVRGVNAY